MKKFVFSLETLQNAKHTQENELRKELSAVEARLSSEQLTLEHLRQESAILRELWLARMVGGLNPAEIQQFNQSFGQLNDQAKTRQAQIQKISQEKAQCQDRLIRLLTEIKSLENLREQQLAGYKQELAQEQAKEIDDFITGQRKQTSTRPG